MPDPSSRPATMTTEMPSKPVKARPPLLDAEGDDAIALVTTLVVVEPSLVVVLVVDTAVVVDPDADEVAHPAATTDIGAGAVWAGAAEATPGMATAALASRMAPTATISRGRLARLIP
jgi:hypothetical protein